MYNKIAGIISICIIGIILGGNLLTDKSLAMFNDLPEVKVLRLHVLANSDLLEDQALKLEVKDEVLNLLAEDFAEINDQEIAWQSLERKIPEIKLVAEKVIEKSGYDYQVEVELGEHEFPTKSYGEVILPQGKYPSLRILIGEARGKNWWCVLFPPMCFVSSSENGLILDKPSEFEVKLKCLEYVPEEWKSFVGN